MAESGAPSDSSKPSVDPGRIQGFGSASAEEDAQEKPTDRFWNAFSTLREQIATPAVRSAIDDVTLRVGDAFEAAQQDLNEMAHEFQSYLTDRVGGFAKDADELPEGAAEVKLASDPSLTPELRQAAVAVVSKFCEKFSTRAAPTKEELDTLWGESCEMAPNALASAFYDQLSWTAGDLEWQPRLRALHALEYFYWKDGVGKAVASAVFVSARSLIKHLEKEVPQCSQQAQQLTSVLKGQVTQPKAEVLGTKGSVDGGSPSSAPAEHCPSCGAAFLKDAAFCQKCGAKRPGWPPAVSSSTAAAGGVASAPAVQPAVQASPPIDLLDLSAPEVVGGPAAAVDLLSDGPAQEPQFNPNGNAAGAEAWADFTAGGGAAPANAAAVPVAPKFYRMATPPTAVAAKAQGGPVLLPYIPSPDKVVLDRQPDPFADLAIHLSTG
mmetsp:Transcript_62554/g.116315  ORF Transcript_62554/g.116315 Transcript_62554/m.116315 type:complete len:437 (-) Transcript_62554:133-1443(-)